MSVRGRNTARASLAHFFAILPLAVLLALAGCGDGVFSPNKAGNGQLRLQPFFSTVDWQSLTADINVIRVTARELPARSVVLNQETSVDPNAAEWQLPLDLPINSEVEVLIELIHRGSAGDITVYSGRTLIRVKAGGPPTAALVPVFPGPPGNLDITSLTIAPKNQGLLEGEQLQLTANVAGSTNPTILWSSSNPDIVAVDASGVVRAVGLGQATIQAVAGPKSDNVTIDVGARVTAIELTPTEVTLLSLDDEVAFKGRALDARSAEIDLPVTYQISDATIAVHLGNGRFRAQRSGNAIITASVVQKGQTISATTTLNVQQTAIRLSVNPPTQDFSSLGENHTFTADARDAKGNPVAGNTLSWATSDASVATVDGKGLVTAVGNGTASITAKSGSVSASADVTVQQVGVSITVAPSNLTLNIEETFQLAASVFDARGNVMNVPIIWTLNGNHAIATITPDGLLRTLQPGSVTVTATFGNLQGAAGVTVRAPVKQVVFDRPQLSLVRGEVQQVSAFLADDDGNLLSRAVTYTTQDPTIATVDASGVVTAVSAGQTFIIATSQSFQARLPVTVISPITQIIFDRTDLQLVEGQSQQVAAFLADALGSPGPGDPIVFSSADLTVASVNSAGVVTAQGIGTTEIIATSQGLERRLTVTVAVAPGGDIVVIPDLNVFEESPSSPSNRTMLQNLVTFTGTGPRASGTWVWLNQPDATNCAFCGKTFDFMQSEIKQTGLKPDRAVAGNGRLTSIPSAVKALFIYAENGFTPNEAGVLRAFVATGGRLIVLGGHGGASAEHPDLNALLALLGSDLRAGTRSLGCGRGLLPAASLRAHQVTAGMTDFRPGCNVELLLGSGDIGLIYDQTNTIPIIAVTRAGGGQN